MKTTFLFLWLVLLSVSASGQVLSIKGTVRDMNGPVSNATVEVEGESGSKLITTTDSEGIFYFSIATPGTYEIYAFGASSERGNRGLAARVSVGSPAPSNITVDIVLPVISAEVFVAVGESQPIEEVSKTVDVIDAQQMRDRVDFALIETLRTIPGFRVQQLGGFGRTANIKTRGLRNSDTAVLIDGIRFRDATAITGDASPFLSDLTLTSVDKIEVLRGSGSSLYGTNAIGGTIDFRTPEARKGTHGQIGGAFGGLGLGRFRGNISHGADKFGITAGVSRTAYTNGIDGDDNANNTNFQSRLDVKPSVKTLFSGRFFVSDADVRLNSDPDTAGTLPVSNTTIIDAIPDVTFVPDVNDPDKTQRSKLFNGQFTANYAINGNTAVRGFYQGLKTKRTNDNGLLGIGFQSTSTSVFDGMIHTANARLNWAIGKGNNVTVGYEFESEDFENNGQTPSGASNFFTRAGQKSHTFYVQDLVSLLDGNFQLAGGFRAQRFSLDAPEFSLTNAPYNNLTLNNPPTAYTFDGAASYFVRKSGTKFRAHVGNGYRVPSLYERFGTFGPSEFSSNFTAIGDPFLKPEKTIAFDAGIEQDAANERVRLSATYFYTRLRDIIGYGFPVPPIGDTPRPFGGYENQKGGIARGGEFSIKAKPSSSTDIFASYTFTNSDQREPQVQFSGILKTLGVPDHQFTLVATQRFKRAWINFDFLATSDYLAPIFDTNGFTFMTYVYRFKGNRKGDLTVGYTFGIKKEQWTLRLYGTVENVFDQEYYENGFKTAGATGRVGLSFGF